jgi:hypothetical protein
VRCAGAVALAAAALATACSFGEASRPEPGPAAGPVSVDVSAALLPGATVVLDLSAEGRTVGSACVTIDHWENGGWRSAWWWERSSSQAQPIPRDDEVTCPAIGVALPTTMTVTLPPDLPPGTWRVAYAAEDDLGAYLFEVR